MWKWLDKGTTQFNSPTSRAYETISQESKKFARATDSRIQLGAKQKAGIVVIDKENKRRTQSINIIDEEANRVHF